MNLEMAIKRLESRDVKEIDDEDIEAVEEINRLEKIKGKKIA